MANERKGNPTATRCSFCGKSSEDVDKLVAGPGVYICDGCIRLCNEILQEGGLGSPSNVSLAWKDTLTDDEMLLHVGRVAATTGQVNESLQLWVDTLRERGVTWARIGAALEMTRQSAWERFSGEE